LTQNILKNEMVLGSGIVLGSVGTSILLILACPCRLLEDTVSANRKYPYIGCIP
jgi:hypothetical protein